MSTQYNDMKPGPGGQVYTPAPAYGQPTVVTQPAQVVMVRGAEDDRPSNTAAIIFACFVTWCCCCPLGLAAFIFGLQAGSDDNINEAHRKLSLSKKLSIAGVIIGIIFIVIFNVFRFTVYNKNNNSY